MKKGSFLLARIRRLYREFNMFKNRFFSNSDMILWYYRRQQIVVHVKKDASVFLTISTDICQIIQLCREKFSNKKAGKTQRVTKIFIFQIYSCCLFLKT